VKPATIDDRIKNLVRLLGLAKPDELGVFRSFCILAVKWESDPEEFRGRLVRAGLESSRASEIKSLLSVPKFRDFFIAKKSIWKRSVAMARRKLGIRQGLYLKQKRAAKLAGFMCQHGLKSVACELGRVELLPRGTSVAECLPRKRPIYERIIA
jgi:hypothetical protein